MQEEFIPESLVPEYESPSLEDQISSSEIKPLGPASWRETSQMESMAERPDREESLDGSVKDTEFRPKNVLVVPFPPILQRSPDNTNFPVS